MHKTVAPHAEWMSTALPTDDTVAVPYWCDDEHWLFDPWASSARAASIHQHCHTKWAERIFKVWRDGPFSLPAEFSWEGETVYIIGRGVSLEASLPLLRRREGRALWLNHSFLAPGAEFRAGDYVMSFDAAVASPELALAAFGKPLIFAPQIGMEVVGLPWSEHYIFTNWNPAPLNDFARELFPAAPGLLECLGISTAALHLASKSGAKKIVLVGQDNVTSEVEGVSITLADGREVNAEPFYAMIAQACTMLAFFAHRRTGVEIVNSSAVPLVGQDFLCAGERATPVPWMKCDALERHVGG